MIEKDKQYIFDRLKFLIHPYEKHLVIKKNTPTRYEVEFDKGYSVTSERTGKTMVKHGLYFVGIMMQSSYVGFYFMPIYANPSVFSGVSPDLRKLLKGKSCFHIKTYDERLFWEIEKMVKRGYQIFKKMN